MKKYSKNGIRLNELQKKNIECFKHCCNNYYNASAGIKSLDFKEYTGDSQYILCAAFDCGSFTQRISYQLFSWLLPACTIDTDFFANGCDYPFTLYDIFNLFDINDFDLYYFPECISESLIKKAFIKLTDASDNYYSYIKKAFSQDYFSTLLSNYESDQLAVAGAEWKKELSEPFYICSSHPYFTSAADCIIENGTASAEHIIYNEEYSTLYERRLFRYFDNDGETSAKHISRSAELENRYFRLKTIVKLLICVASMVVVIMAVLLNSLIVFSGADYVYSLNEGLRSGFGIILLIFSVIAFAVAFSMLFTKHILILITPKDIREEVMEKYYYKNSSEQKKLIKYIENVIMFIFSVVAFAVCFGLATSDFAVYDDCIKYTDFAFASQEIPADYVGIYKVAGEYYGEDFEEFTDNSVYIIYDTSQPQNNYITNDLKLRGKTESQINSFANFNGIIIEPIDTIQTFYDLVGDN